MIERIEVNLLPAEYRIHHSAIKLSRELIYGALVLILLVLGLTTQTAMIESEIAQQKTAIADIDKQIKVGKPIKDQILRLKKDHEQAREKIRALQRIDVNRGKWVRLLEILCEKIPPYTWIASASEITKEGTQRVQIEGRTFVFPEVATFMSDLVKSEYIASVDLSTIEQISAGKDKAFRFSITCLINPDAGLDKIMVDSASRR